MNNDPQEKVNGTVMANTRKQYRVEFANSRGDRRVVVLRRAKRQTAIDDARAHVKLTWQGDNNETWSLQSAKAIGKTRFF